MAVYGAAVARPLAMARAAIAFWHTFGSGVRVSSWDLVIQAHINAVSGKACANYGKSHDWHEGLARMTQWMLGGFASEFEVINHSVSLKLAGLVWHAVKRVSTVDGASSEYQGAPSSRSVSMALRAACSTVQPRDKDGSPLALDPKIPVGFGALPSRLTLNSTDSQSNRLHLPDLTKAKKEQQRECSP